MVHKLRITREGGILFFRLNFIMAMLVMTYVLVKWITINGLFTWHFLAMVLCLAYFYLSGILFNYLYEPIEDGGAANAKDNH